MYMDILEGKVGTVKVCGQTGGLPFENVTRAYQNGTCPDTYSPCITDASPENTLCYPANELD